MENDFLSLTSCPFLGMIGKIKEENRKPCGLSGYRGYDKELAKAAMSAGICADRICLFWRLLYVKRQMPLYTVQGWEPPCLI